MKSYIKRTGILGAFLLTFASCETILEEYNPSGLTAETVFTTPEGFETLVNAAYSYQRCCMAKKKDTTSPKQAPIFGPRARVKSIAI